MRKTLLLLLAMMVLTTHTGMAATIDAIRFEGGIAYISGTAEKDSRLTIMAVKKGNVPTGDTNVGLVHEMTIGEDGNYSFGFVINDLPDGTDMSGWYTMMVSDAQAAEKDFYFATQTAITTFINGIKTAKTNSNETEFKTVFANTDIKILECLGMDFVTHASVKDVILTNMYKNCTASTLNQETVYKEYGKALGFVLLNQGNDEGVTHFNPSSEGKEFKQITDPTASAFIKQVMASATYADYASVETQYQKAYALNTVNQANSAKLARLLVGYETLLGLSADADYQYYRNTTPTIRAAISEDVVDALYLQKAYTSAELLTVIHNAVAANKPQNTPGGGAGAGGGGGSSGGGGGGGSAFAVSKEPVSTVKPDSSQDKNTAVFSDLSKTLWAEKAISYLYERGIVNGTGFGTFEPNRDVKREEFIKMLILATSAYEKSAVCEFTDIDRKEWYYPYVASAYQKGIVNGYEDNTFGVGNTLTREEAATMLARCADSLTAVRDYPGFADDTEISDWAKDHVVTLYKAGIINGADGGFNPKNNITRAEAAQMLYGYLEGGV